MIGFRVVLIVKRLSVTLILSGVQVKSDYSFLSSSLSGLLGWLAGGLLGWLLGDGLLGSLWGGLLGGGLLGGLGGFLWCSSLCYNRKRQFSNVFKWFDILHFALTVKLRRQNFH